MIHCLNCYTVSLSGLFYLLPLKHHCLYVNPFLTLYVFSDKTCEAEISEEAVESAHCYTLRLPSAALNTVVKRLIASMAIGDSSTGVCSTGVARGVLVSAHSLVKYQPNRRQSICFTTQSLNLKQGFTETNIPFPVITSDVFNFNVRPVSWNY